jgi:hypothetical protein
MSAPAISLAIRMKGNVFRIAICIASLASLANGGSSQDAWPPWKGKLNPNKAHIWLQLYGGFLNGTPQPPDVRFYDKRDLSGQPVIRLDAGGLTIGKQLVCTWSGGQFGRVIRGPGFVLEAAGGGSTGNGRECSPDLPIKSFLVGEGPYLFIEVTRLDGSLVEVRYREEPYYFSLKSLPGNPWSSSPRYTIELPEKSPPLLGVVDIPAIFRPASRVRPAVILRRAPRLDSPTVRTVSSANDFVSVGLGEGTLTASVYARSGRWSLMRLLDGRQGWLAPADAGKFASFERVLRNHAPETYMSYNWDRMLARAPGGSERFAVPHDPRRSWLGYLEPIGGIVRVEFTPYAVGEPGQQIATIEKQHPGDTYLGHFRRRSNGTEFLEFQTARALPLFATPDRNDVPIGQLEGLNPEKTLETVSVKSANPRDPRGESQAGAIVFSHRPGWFEVALREADEHDQKKRVWIEDTPSAWALHDVPPVEADRLLTEVWGNEKLPAVSIKEAKRVAGALWLHVEVLMGGGCEIVLSELPHVVLAEGWVPAHDALGRPTVWFEIYCD